MSVQNTRRYAIPQAFESLPERSPTTLTHISESHFIRFVYHRLALFEISIIVQSSSSSQESSSVQRYDAIICLITVCIFCLLFWFPNRELAKRGACYFSCFCGTVYFVLSCLNGAFNEVLPNSHSTRFESITRGFNFGYCCRHFVRLLPWELEEQKRSGNSASYIKAN